MIKFLFFTACSNRSIETPISWKEKFSIDNNDTISEIRRLSNPIEQESAVMEIVESFPKSAKQMCTLLQTKLAKTRCQRFIQRPHLSTVDISSAPLKWTRGDLYERLAFPSDFTAFTIDRLEPPKCPNQAPGECIEKHATQSVKEKQYRRAASYCKSHESNMAQYDCLFTVAEKMPPNQYETARHFCAASGPFAPECHNHLILGAAVYNWTNDKKHKDYIQTIRRLWRNSVYAESLASAYWSTVASRVAGVIQPYSNDDFKSFPLEFAPHLRSAVALRVFLEKEPLKRGLEAMNGKQHHLPKAHGPGSPVFQPKPVWKENTNRKSIHFSDIRGGLRPISNDIETDLELAIITAMAMSPGISQKQIFDRIDQNLIDLTWVKKEFVLNR